MLLGWNFGLEGRELLVPDLYSMPDCYPSLAHPIGEEMEAETGERVAAERNVKFRYDIPFDDRLEPCSCLLIAARNLLDIPVPPTFTISHVANPRGPLFFALEEIVDEPLGEVEQDVVGEDELSVLSAELSPDPGRVFPVALKQVEEDPSGDIEGAVGEAAEFVVGDIGSEEDWDMFAL